MNILSSFARWAPLAAVLAAIVIVAGSARGEVVDAIAATVDTEVILQSDLTDQVGPLLENLRLRAKSQGEFEREAKKAMREALDLAIERRILYCQSVLAGLELPEQDLEARIEKMIKQYPSREEFMKVLDQAGETMSDFRERVRKQLMAIAMGMRKRREFEDQAVIAESEMKQHYEDHKADFLRPERVRASRIFLAADKDPEARASVKVRLEQIREEAVAGANFGDLARRYSEGPDASEGGRIGWVLRGDLVAPLEEAAFALEVGGISEVVETEWGFHLLRVEAKEEETVAAFEAARTEIEPMLRGTCAEERYQDWMRELRKRSRVRVFL